MRRRFTQTTLLVAGILCLALALRLIEVERTSYRPINDAGSYLSLASQIARTGDYSTSRATGAGAGGTRGPSAYFPPGYPYFLAAVDLVTGHSSVVRIHGHTRIPSGAVQAARISQALLGTVTVALVGLVALEALGALPALIALLLAAVYPVFIGLAGTIVAENLSTPLILAAVWAALRAQGSPHAWRWLAGSGLLAGLATLTHVNDIVLVIPLALLAWTAFRRSPDRGAWASVAGPALVVGFLVVALVPWLARNAIVMPSFVFVSDETGITLVGTYNSASAANPGVPYKWRLYYGIPGERNLIRQSGHLTEVQLSSRLLTQAENYVSDHPLSPVSVAFHNSLRLLELEGSFAWRASAAAIDLPADITRVGVVSFWLLCLVALAGAFTRTARRAWRWLWVAPILLWLSVALVNAETPRFREPVDAFLILFAACGLAAAVRWLRQRLGGAPVAVRHVVSLSAGAGEGVEVGERLP